MKAHRKQYAWRAGFHYPREAAESVGVELERLDREGGSKGLTAARLVEAAAAPESPLHAFYEWDDSVAAHKHRLDQARTMLRAIVIIEAHNPVQSYRAFINVKSRADDAADTREIYVPAIAVLTDEQRRQEVVERALGEAELWRQRYYHLNELASICDAIIAARAEREREPVQP